MRKAQLSKTMRGQSVLLAIAASLLLAVLLYACSPSKNPSAAAVESYLRALVDKDEARLVGLTCKEFEADALLEFDSFSLVKTRLEGLKCQVQGTSESTASVTCQGQIIATYGAEDQQFDLSGRKYQVQKEGSDWLICGQ